jgi:hypothetical protein
MRTSFHHQPEAQHPHSPPIYTPAGRLPHLSRDRRTAAKSVSIRSPPKADIRWIGWHVRYVPILLQKSKVAGRRIFRENPKREALADSYDLNRITEVACEFNVRR